MNELDVLLDAYYKSDELYQAGKYWKRYENKIIRQIKNADLNELRSVKYPIFATFGFVETVYFYHPNQSFYKKLVLKLLRLLNHPKIPSMPYSLYLQDIRELAFQHCILQGKLSGLKSIEDIEVSDFGNPQDIFEINGKKYTMVFLTYYIRLCFVHQYQKFKGDETIVELGSGSGHQVEVLKKVFPSMTILCFDLPYNLYLCNVYLKNALGEKNIFNARKGIVRTNLNDIEKGKVHFFGNWQFPLLADFKFDLFWNAASFGEMEPHLVKNYLSFVVNKCRAVYLLQARHGKEQFGGKGVNTPITLEDYKAMLYEFKLINEEEPWQAHRKLKEGIGYFHGVWKKD